MVKLLSNQPSFNQTPSTLSYSNVEIRAGAPPGYTSADGKIRNLVISEEDQISKGMWVFC